MFVLFIFPCEFLSEHKCILRFLVQSANVYFAPLMNLYRERISLLDSRNLRSLVTLAQKLNEILDALSFFAPTACSSAGFSKFRALQQYVW